MRETTEIFEIKIYLGIKEKGEMGKSALYASSRMQATNPDVKVIVASGYLDRDTKLEMLKEGAKEFVHKPYVPSEIMRRIHKVIDGVLTVKRIPK